MNGTRTVFTPVVVAMAWSAAGASTLSAQAPDDGPGYRTLDRGREIALARSAAPPEVSADATIWVLDDGTFQVAVPGTNGNACMVARSRPRSLEPICYDPEGARTLLPMEHRRLELRLSGMEGEAIDRQLAADVESGRLEAPARPTLAYMLSAGQELVSADGRPVGAWKPHFMVYIPGLEHADVGLPHALGQVQVAYEGLPWASLITVAPDFVEPEEAGGVR